MVNFTETETKVLLDAISDIVKIIETTETETKVLLDAIIDHEPTNNDTEYYTFQRESIEQIKKDAILKLRYLLLEVTK